MVNNFDTAMTAIVHEIAKESVIKESWETVLHHLCEKELHVCSPATYFLIN